ncbi:MAG: CAP domain-containing protein [Chloroflexota bacterium]|nr:CAP domain-containing protein [Chloroflexota bacterium]
MRKALPRHTPRLVALAFAAMTLWSFVPGVSALTDLTPAQAEAEVVRLLNQQRGAVGVVAARVDSRLTQIARARSYDMATKHYFDHRQPDGRYVWDLLDAARIRWYEVGEDIAWNSWSTFRDSATGAATQWRNSAPHYAIITDRDFNYVGVGVAVEAGTGRKYWTAVFMKGPDRTGAWARMNSGILGTRTGYTRTVTVSWRGADVPLSVLTSGLYSFTVQKRIDGGVWNAPYTTTKTSWTGSLYRGHRYEYRVIARDRAGNYGGWSPLVTILP